MRPVETIPGIRGEGIKKNDGGVNSTMIIVRTSINLTTYT
jgi:hypothetical protein